jgi:hypothetical protein
MALHPQPRENVSGSMRGLDHGVDHVGEVTAQNRHD